MKSPVYSIRDAATAFGQVFIDTSDSCARRNFSFAINNNDQMHFSAKDYDLYRIGEFDHDTGVITPIGVPEFIVAGASVVTNNEK